MSLAKSILLEAHGGFKTCLKPGKTPALGFKHSNFDLDHEELCRKTKNSKIIKIYQYLQCF